ncbi:hypothetical protein AL755_02830 (plasmid) [Arthrobacter sp. ERGS1:01]|nr:hypothetical protein AL755_02830 [Arthrobacter sp. ERGS1:01]
MFGTCTYSMVFQPNYYVTKWLSANLAWLSTFIYTLAVESIVGSSTQACDSSDEFRTPLEFDL